jgi:hypothetical protein
MEYNPMLWRFWQNEAKFTNAFNERDPIGSSTDATVTKAAQGFGLPVRLPATDQQHGKGKRRWMQRPPAHLNVSSD